MSRSSRGSVSVAMATVVLPMMMIVMSLVVESGQFFSALHSLQEAVDSECEHALSRKQSPAFLEAALRGRIKSLGVHAEILSIAQSEASRTRRVSVQGRYRGPVLTIISDLVPGAPVFIPFSVESVVRGLSAASLLLLDPTVSAADAGCTDGELLRMERFSERLVQELHARSGVRVVGGALPSGNLGLREISFTSARADGLSRCVVSSQSDGPSALFAIRGDVPASINAGTLSAEVAALLTSRVLSGPEEIPSVALVLRNRMHLDGTAATLLDAIESEARRQKRKVQALVVFVGGASRYQEASHADGRYGLEMRRIFGPSDDLQSASFVHAAASMMSDRIVVAH